jgi:VWFA-related protein
VKIAAAFGCVCLLAAAAAMRAQDAGGSPLVIRAESREVLVDAVVVDKNGKFARDLAAKDFRIWEDNKEQKISGFSLESSGVSPERPSKHYIAMLFDTSSTAASSGLMAARQEGVRFVEGFASPDRYMAVVSFNINGGLRVGQNFTVDKDLAKKALNSLSATQGNVPTAADPQAAALRTNARGRGAAPPPSDQTNDLYEYRNMLAGVRNLAVSLASIRGRKALVLFSGGIAMTGDLSPEIQATIDACNKANVALYTVGPGPGGTDNSPTSASAVSARTTQRGNTAPISMIADLSTNDQDAARLLSEGTGGISFTTTNDLAASLGKVAQEQDQYYLLTYTPAADSPEGSCHELRVKVDRSDMEVRARGSYCTSKPVDALSGKPAGAALEARAANGGAGNIVAKMQLPWFYEDPGAAKVDVVMDFVPSAMKFQKEKGRLHGEFDLAGVAMRADGSAAARVSDTVKVDFDTQQQADAFLKAPYHYENQFDILPGQYTFRMAFSDGSAGFGKVEMPLKVEGWDSKSLGASGIALSHDEHPAADLAAGLDASLLEGMRPLVAKGAEIAPTGINQFRAGEPGFFYIEVYEPLLAEMKAGATPPLVGVRTRVLDRATGTQKEDSGIRTAVSFMRAGNPVVPIVSPLPVQSLTAGAYELEVTVMRQTGEPVVRTADFDIN